MQLFALLEALIEGERRDSLFKERAGWGHTTIDMSPHIRFENCGEDGGG
jgi:hypothetical protein